MVTTRLCADGRGAISIIVNSSIIISSIIINSSSIISSTSTNTSISITIITFISSITKRPVVAPRDYRPPHTRRLVPGPYAPPTSGRVIDHHHPSD